MEFSPSIVSGLLMWNRSEKLRDTPVQTEDNNSAGQKIISPLVYRCAACYLISLAIV